MAIARGAGTEIIRSAHFEDINGTNVNPLIVGAQHHIYTVLSIVIYANAVNTTGTDYVHLSVGGYDAFGGTTNQAMYLYKWFPNAEETFVWNDKFSFNGTEPTDFAGPMDDAAKQNAIADQATSTAQKLQVYVSHASTTVDINLTYIDQNNA